MLPIVLLCRAPRGSYSNERGNLYLWSTIMAALYMKWIWASFGSLHRVTKSSLSPVRKKRCSPVRCFVGLRGMDFWHMYALVDVAHSSQLRRSRQPALAGWLAGESRFRKLCEYDAIVYSPVTAAAAAAAASGCHLRYHLALRGSLVDKNTP